MRKCKCCGQDLPFPYVSLTPKQRVLFDALFKAFREDPKKTFTLADLDTMCYGPKYMLRGSHHTSRVHLSYLREALKPTVLTITTYPYRMVFSRDYKYFGKRKKWPATQVANQSK